MADINYFATPSDNEQLRNLLEDLNVIILPWSSKANLRFDDHPFEPRSWYLSRIDPANVIESDDGSGCPASCNPLISFGPAFVKQDKKILVSGNFSWMDFDEQICSEYGVNRDDVVEIGKVFEKIRRWIRKNFRRVDGDSFWYGPDAARLRMDEGFGAGSNFSDNTIFEQIVIDDDGKEIEKRYLNDISEFGDR